ncbi:MAG: tRNA-specific adenosine deaminase, partial [Pseudomonadales bacterium]|nr:tRNA-specific adenosine deaminase [Pseudomonadales bacterium]
AIVHARVSRLVFGAPEPRAGAVVSQQRLLDVSGYNHQVEYIGGVLGEESGRMLQDFFRSRR